jgi:nucleotide-binding universal stress UspA family protein
MATIVVGTDGSESAAAAVRTALELAGLERIVFVSVWSPLPSSYGFALPPSGAYGEVLQARRQAAEAALAEARGAAWQAGVSFETRLLEGDPAGEICRVARECNARLVVVGSHGWGALRRLLYGSVATGVLHRAPCEVLVVRPAREQAARAQTATAAAHA